MSVSFGPTVVPAQADTMGGRSVKGDEPMCLTPKAMLLFLSMISPEKFETSETRIVVRGDAETVVWAVKGDSWCIEPQGVET